MAKLKEKSSELDGQLEQLTLLFGKGTVITASSKKLNGKYKIRNKTPKN